MLPTEPADRVAMLASLEFQALADSVPQLLWISHPDGAVSYMNERWLEYAGISTPPQWRSALHPDDATATLAEWERVRDTGEQFEQHYRIRRADGIYRWHLARAAAHFKDGRIVCWLGSATDVHDQREQTQELLTMFELEGSGKAICDIATGRILRANGELTKITGYALEELHGLTIRDLQHHEDRRSDDDAMRSLRDGRNTSSTTEKRYLRRDDGVLWVEVQLSVIPGASGERPSRALATITDISARKRGEMRYRTLVNASSSIVWAINPDGEMVEPQRAWEAFTGQSWEQHRGFGWIEMIHPDDRAGIKRGRQQRDAAEATWSSGRVWCAARQQYRYFIARAVPIIGPDGEVLEWIGTTTDVDEQRRAELANAFLVRADPILGSSLDTPTIVQSLSRLAIESFAEWCILDLDRPDGTLHRAAVVHRDPAMQPLLDVFRDVPVPPRELAPMLYETYEKGTPNILPLIPASRIAELRAGPNTAIYAQLGLASCALLPLRASRGVIGVLAMMSSVPYQFSTSDVPYLMELARRAALAIENARLYEAAQAANEAKDSFLANLSHELRTPMTAIVGWSSLLATGEYDAAMLSTGISAIRQSAQAQTRLIEDLLDLSAAAAGKLVLAPEVCNLRDIVERAVRAVEIGAHAKNIALLVTQANAPIVADEDRMQQAIGNLLSNAIKFTPSGGEVRVTVSTDGDDATVRIRDSGRGIDPAFLPRIFDRFTQEAVAPESSQRGLGLGLSIVRQIVELHGGSIAAKSPGHGRGSEFVLRVPLQRAADGDPSTVAQAGWQLPSLDRLRVLVVEDDPGTRAFISATLTRCGAELHAVESAELARAELSAQRFDLLLSDIALPGADGIALVTALRAGECGPSDIPALAVTAFSYGLDRERILGAGFDDYLRKPVNPVELAHRVAAAVSQH
jgi:PAS domain S-box-containing protein